MVQRYSSSYFLILFSLFINISSHRSSSFFFINELNTKRNEKRMKKLVTAGSMQHYSIKYKLYVNKWYTELTIDEYKYPFLCALTGEHRTMRISVVIIFFFFFSNYDCNGNENYKKRTAHNTQCTVMYLHAPYDHIFWFRGYLALRSALLLVHWLIGANNRRWWKWDWQDYCILGFVFLFFWITVKNAAPRTTNSHSHHRFVSGLLFSLCTFVQCSLHVIFELQTNKWTEKESIYHHTDEITIVLMFQAHRQTT